MAEKHRSRQSKRDGVFYYPRAMTPFIRAATASLYRKGRRRNRPDYRIIRLPCPAKTEGGNYWLGSSPPISMAFDVETKVEGVRSGPTSRAHSP